eukprot:6196173-Pleurochrysis_carterae.AAC.2
MWNGKQRQDVIECVEPGKFAYARCAIPKGGPALRPCRPQRYTSALLNNRLRSRTRDPAHFVELERHLTEAHLCLPCQWRRWLRNKLA